MSAFKWLTLAVAGVSFALIAGLLACMTAATAAAVGGPADVLWPAALASVVVGGLLWLAASAHDAELRQVHAQVRALADAPRSAGPMRSHFGLDVLRVAAEQVVAPLYDRASQIDTLRRDARSAVRNTRFDRCRLQGLADMIEDAVLVTDASHQLMLANRAAAEWLSFDPQRGLYQRIDQVIKYPTLVKLIQQAGGGERSAITDPVRQRMRIPGQARIFDITARPTTAADGGEDGPIQSGGAIVVLRDVTAEVETAGQRGEFVASASHELRTPLASIKGCLELLIDGEATDAVNRSEFYNIIQTEANRLSQLIDSILSISRMEAGLARMQRESIVLADVIEEAVSIVEPQTRAKQLNLIWKPPEAVIAAPGDRDMLLQVLLHLLGNAVKYTPAGGRIEIAVAVDVQREAAEVTVSDTGVGIPLQAIPHLFDKFYRVSDHRRLAKGVGLGLNLAKRIVETMHGGSLTVDSEPERGSAFTFALPMADNQTGDCASPWAFESSSAGVDLPRNGMSTVVEAGHE